MTKPQSDLLQPTSNGMKSIPAQVEIEFQIGDDGYIRLRQEEPAMEGMQFDGAHIVVIHERFIDDVIHALRQAKRELKEQP